jgi:hypothetical protein
MFPVTKIQAQLKGNPAPELDVKQWINAPLKESLDKLHGKAVKLLLWDKSVWTATPPLPTVSMLDSKFAPAV